MVQQKFYEVYFLGDVRDVVQFKVRLFHVAEETAEVDEKVRFVRENEVELLKFVPHFDA